MKSIKAILIIFALLGGPVALATSESDIPVQLETVKKAGSEDSGLFRAFMMIGVLGVVCCATYIYMRRSKMTAATSKSAPQIKILTQHYLGPKKSLAIVRVAGESVLVGITDSNISLIKSLSLLDEDVPEEVPKAFGNVLQKTQAVDAAIGADEEDREFSLGGIRDFVSQRLKTMKDLE